MQQGPLLKRYQPQSFEKPSCKERTVKNVPCCKFVNHCVNQYRFFFFFLMQNAIYVGSSLYLEHGVICEFRLYSPRSLATVRGADDIFLPQMHFFRPLFSTNSHIWPHLGSGRRYLGTKRPDPGLFQDSCHVCENKNKAHDATDQAAQTANMVIYKKQNS